MKLKPYKIGLRTVKTAFGMALGVYLAKMLGVQNYSSAAILVVLCVKNTKMKSVEAASARFVSCIMALLMSYVFFTYMGHEAGVIGLLVLLFIPITVMFGVQEGVVTSCVMMLHCFNQPNITVEFLVNEFLLLCIGIGIGLLLNLIMPKHDKMLKNYKDTIEREFQVLMAELSDALKFPEMILDVSKVEKVKKTIASAKSLAFNEVENHFSRNENSYYFYFDMRQNQLDIIERMMVLINRIDCKEKLHLHCSELLMDCSRNISSNNYTAIRLHDLYEIQLNMDQHPLPKTTEQLNSRAAAIQLLNELEEYLNIKSKFGSLKLY